MTKVGSVGDGGPTESTADSTPDDAADLRDTQAAVRDVAASVRDAHGDLRDHALTLDDAENARGVVTRAPYRDASTGDRESAADDRAASARDRASAKQDREEADQLVDSLMHDGMTGFYQRDPGLTKLAREVVKCQRTGEPFTIAFVDIDGLKAVNDSKGHEAGDRLIMLVADAVRSVLREYDVVVRYGGDEYLCGLQGVDERQAQERFTEMHAMLVERGTGTASIGIAQLTEEDTLQQLISRADDAMYAAKARNAAQLS